MSIHHDQPGMDPHGDSDHIFWVLIILVTLAYSVILYEITKALW